MTRLRDDASLATASLVSTRRFGLSSLTVSTVRAHHAELVTSWDVHDDCLADTVRALSETLEGVLPLPGPGTLELRTTLTSLGVVAAVRVHADGHPDDWIGSRPHRCRRPHGSIPVPTAAGDMPALSSGSAVLVELAAGLARAVTAAQVDEVVAGCVRAHCGATFTGLALVDVHTITDDVPQMYYLDLSAFPEATRHRWRRFPLDIDAPVAAVARSATAAFHATAGEADDDHPGISEQMHTAGVAALAHLPLLADGVCLGTLALAWAQPRPFPPEVRSLLTVVAGFTAQALNRRDDRAVGAALARRRLADARTEYDRALDDGRAMPVLRQLDAEVQRAAGAVRDLRSGLR